MAKTIPETVIEAPVMTCGECVHFADLGVNPQNVKERRGECRRFPPTCHALPMQTQQGIQVSHGSAYPPVRDAVPACGEFQINGMWQEKKN